MSNITWLGWVFLALALVVMGLVTLKPRLPSVGLNLGRLVPSATTMKKFWSVVWRISIVGAIIYGCWSIRQYYKEDQSAKISALKVEVEQATQVQAAKEYSANWKCKPGEMFEGMIESGPQKAVIKEYTSTNLLIYVYYTEFESPEHSWLSLHRNGAGQLWEGEWGQENPRRSGKITLEQRGNEEVWKGIMTGKNKQDFLYTVERTK